MKYLKCSSTVTPFPPPLPQALLKPLPRHRQLRAHNTLASCLTKNCSTGFFWAGIWVDSLNHRNSFSPALWVLQLQPCSRAPASLT